MKDTVTIINLILSGTVTLFTLCTMTIKPFREWVMGAKREKRNQIETDKCLLRDRILNVYYSHYEDKKLKHYEYENITYMYAQYKELGGNSFVDNIWEEIKKWKIE